MGADGRWGRGGGKESEDFGAGGAESFTFFSSYPPLRSRPQRPSAPIFCHCHGLYHPVSAIIIVSDQLVCTPYPARHINNTWSRAPRKRRLTQEKRSPKRPKRNCFFCFVVFVSEKDRRLSETVRTCPQAAQSSLRHYRKQLKRNK